eukprot:2266-Prorocentrum_minimum.AAC.2
MVAGMLADQTIGLGLGSIGPFIHGAFATTVAGLLLVIFQFKFDAKNIQDGRQKLSEISDSISSKIKNKMPDGMGGDSSRKEPPSIGVA